MITKEKHYTKCDTPSSSRIIDDRKPMIKLPNGNVELAKGGEKIENGCENKVQVNDVPKSNGEGRQTPRDTSTEDSNASGQKVGTVIPNRIFVGGFSVKTVDDDLWRFFSAISNITAAKIIYDRSGLSKCYGFVTFANPKDAKYIVKQTGGIMFSPMGRLRISQAVRKQMPHYPSPSEYSNPGNPSMPVQQEGFYSNPPCSTKPSVCIGYPMQAVQQVHHVPSVPHVSHGQSGPPIHGTSTQNSQLQANNPPPTQMQARSAPSTSPRSSTAGSSESGIQSNPSHSVTSYSENMYPGTMITGPPTYVIPSMMPYAPSLPAYDASGLYTTCPGYAQPMAYPYAVVLQPPRDGAPTYASPYGPAPITYVPQPSAACYMRDTSGKAPPAHFPIMNSYIY